MADEIACPGSWEGFRVLLGFHLLPPPGGELDVSPFVEVRVFEKALELVETTSVLQGDFLRPGHGCKSALLCRGLAELCLRSSSLEAILGKWHWNGVHFGEWSEEWPSVIED